MDFKDYATRDFLPDYYAKRRERLSWFAFFAMIGSWALFFGAWIILIK